MEIAVLMKLFEGIFSQLRYVRLQTEMWSILGPEAYGYLPGRSVPVAWSDNEH